MQLSLAVVVLFACVALTIQQAPGNGPPSRGPSSPSGQDPPRSGDNPDMSREYPRWRAPGGSGQRRDDGDSNLPSGKTTTRMMVTRDMKWDEEDRKEDMQKSGGLMQKMTGGYNDPSPPPPPPSGIHMKFEFDLGAAVMGAMAGQGGDMGPRRDWGDQDRAPRRDDRWREDMGGKGDNMGGKDGKMGEWGANGGNDGKMGEWGGNGGNDGNKGGKDGNIGWKTDEKRGQNGYMGDKSSNKQKYPMRPHRPILCRVNASGTVVNRTCPFKLVCGGGKGIKQGNWTMFFCRREMPMRDVSEFDYPDQGEFAMKSDDKNGGDMDDKDWDEDDDMDDKDGGMDDQDG